MKRFVVREFSDMLTPLEAVEILVCDKETVETNYISYAEQKLPVWLPIMSRHSLQNLAVGEKELLP